MAQCAGADARHATDRVARNGCRAAIARRPSRDAARKVGQVRVSGRRPTILASGTLTNAGPAALSALATYVCTGATADGTSTGPTDYA